MGRTISGGGIRREEGEGGGDVIEGARQIRYCTEGEKTRVDR